MQTKKQMIKNRVETILKEKGLKKVELAEKLHIARQNIIKVLNSPTIERCNQIAQALDVPVWQLFASVDEVQLKDTGTAQVECPHCGKKFEVGLQVK